MRRAVLCAALVLAAVPLAARGGDFGPPRDVGAVRADARILLTHRAREANGSLDPIAIHDVVVAGDEALLSWRAGSQRGLMGLIRRGNRWWDAFEGASLPGEMAGGCLDATITYPLKPNRFPTGLGQAADSRSLREEDGLSARLVEAASVHNADVRAVDARLTAQPSKTGSLSRSICDFHDVLQGDPFALLPVGGSLSPARQSMSGYALTLRYAKNDAAPDTEFLPPYGRPPTAGEFLPYPTPPLAQGPSSLFIFELGVQGARPVTFAAGSTLQVWFPFALDEAIRYDLSIYFAGSPIGPIFARPFDNTLTFRLPAFTLSPSRRAHAEISGDW